MRMYMPIDFEKKGIYNVQVAEKKPKEIHKSKSANIILIVALIIAAFFLGSLTSKVSYLEKNKTVLNNPKNSVPQAAPSDDATQQAGKIKPVTDADHIRGNKNAGLTLVEYSDYECPFCKRFHPTMQELLQTYQDKIRWVYRHFPLSFHANAQKEAEASECIAELGGNDQFWEFTDKIFERTQANGTGFALDNLGPLALELGVNQAEFQTCLDSGKYEKLVKDQIADGTKAGVSGTPTTFVVDSKGNSQIIVGAQPIEALKTEIDKALAVK